MECEAEWSMNKKLVDLEEKCVTKKVLDLMKNRKLILKNF